MIYPFVCESCGHRFDVVAEAQRAPQHAPCENCDAECHQDWQEKFGTPQVGDIYRYHESLALAVHPKDVAKYREYDAAHGLNVEYKQRTPTSLSRPVFRSRSERLRYLRAHRAMDMDRYS